MRRILGLAFLLALTSVAFGQTYQTASVCHTGTTNCTATVAVTAGYNIIVLADEEEFAAGTFTISDTNSDSFTACSGPISGAASPTRYGGMWCGVAGTTNASEGVKCQFTNATGNVTCSVIVYSGGYTVVDKTANNATAASTSLTSTATSATSQATELVVGAFAAGDPGGCGTTSAGSGYTLRPATESTAYGSVFMEDLVTSSTGAQTATATCTTSSSYNGFVVTLKSGASSCAVPTISPNGIPLGFSSPAASVTLGDATSGCGIVYTTNGTTPTVSSGCTITNGTLYSSALSLSSPTTVEAIGCQTGYTASTAASAVFNLYADQTGSYEFGDNFANYVSPISACASSVCYPATGNVTLPLPMDTWNTEGNWSPNPSVSSAPGPGGSVGAVQNSYGGVTTGILYGGVSGNIGSWLTYVGATGWNGSNVGQYSSVVLQSGQDWAASTIYVKSALLRPSVGNSGGYLYQSQGACVSGTTEPGTWNQTVGGTQTDNSCTWFNTGVTALYSPNPCAIIYSSASSTATSYSLCVGAAALLGKTISGNYTNIATSGTLSGLAGATIELRGLNGVLEPLINGSPISGLSATYSDSSIAMTSGNPGASGTGATNWHGGTINATSPPSPITWGGIASFPSHGPFAWNTSSDTSWDTWPWNIASLGLGEEQVMNYSNNTGLTATATLITVTSTLNPGVGNTVTLSGSKCASGTGCSSGASWDGNYTVATSSATQWTASGTSLNTAAATQYGQTLIKTSNYALGTQGLAGVSQNQYINTFAPAQYVVFTVNEDTTNSAVQNWFGKMQGNSAILGGSATGFGTCYDLAGYYCGEEPEWQKAAGNPPNYPAYPCVGGTSEYCGTLYFHCTKATPATAYLGCAGNANIVTVSGSGYIAMAGDKVLVMYTADGYLQVYCQGTSNSANAPFGGGCPSTAEATQVINAHDADMQNSSATNSPAGVASGFSAGYPGVWAAAPGNPMAIFTNVSVGSITSGVTCATIMGVPCVMPNQYVPMEIMP